jgi:hypothetical protein
MHFKFVVLWGSREGLSGGRLAKQRFRNPLIAGPLFLTSPIDGFTFAGAQGKGEPVEHLSQTGWTL